MDEPRIVDREDPEDVFALLSDDIRVGILEALWAADEPVPFSELREATGIRDSGQFNYHLDKLLGQFVRKTAAGYELTQAGKGINGAIEAGAYTQEATIEPIDLEDPCPNCGGDRRLTYEDELVDIECESCELTYHFVVPPGVFAGYDTEAIPRVASRYLHATFHHIQSGFCWFCEGRTRPRIEMGPEPGEAPDDDPGSDGSGASDGGVPEKQGGEDREGAGDEGSTDVEAVPFVHYDCERCGNQSTSGPWLATLDHPAVRGFYYEHGVDVRERLVWSFPAFDAEHLSVRSRDPLRVSVTHTVGDDTLTLVLDEDAEVVEVEA